LNGKVLAVFSPQEENAIKSFRNIPEVQCILVGELNAYDILCNDYVLFSNSSLPTAKDGE
jgi:large subunit ribosomal protein L4